VLLGVAPTTAHVYQGDRDLGQSPVSIEVPKGQLVSVEVRHLGYETQQLELDGSEPRKSVELVSRNKKKKRVKPRRAAAVSPAMLDEMPTPRPPQSPAEIGGQLFVEPWQKP
jgi:hypothetical protein